MKKDENVSRKSDKFWRQANKMQHKDNRSLWRKKLKQEDVTNFLKLRENFPEIQKL